MNNVVLNIDSSAVAAHANKLKVLNRSAYPVAVRQTLTGAAVDVKTNTMPAEAKHFVQRSPTFFKANSKYEAAKGFDANSMRATVGFVENSGTQQQAVEDMQQQDQGGNISGRAFVPLKNARVGNTIRGRVRAPLRIETIKTKIVDSKKTVMKRQKSGRIKGNAKGQQFTRAAIYAGKGGLVIGNTVVRGQRMLMRIDKIVRKGGRTHVYSKAIYSVKAGRKAHVKPTHFMSTASNLSARKMERMFIVNAEKQFRKAGL